MAAAAGPSAHPTATEQNNARLEVALRHARPQGVQELVETLAAVATGGMPQRACWMPALRQKGHQRVPLEGRKTSVVVTLVWRGSSAGLSVRGSVLSLQAGRAHKAATVRRVE